MERIYSVLDRKLKEFGNLTLERNDETVRRSLADALRGSKSLVELHPEDFLLYCVGEFDRESGTITAIPPRLIANVGEILEARVDAKSP